MQWRCFGCRHFCNNHAASKAFVGTNCVRLHATQFAKEWAGKGNEKGESQPFWIALLRQVFGIENPEQYIQFETQPKALPKGTAWLR